MYLKSFLLKYSRVCNESNTTGVTSRAGTVTCLSGAPEFSPGFVQNEVFDIHIIVALAFYNKQLHKVQHYIKFQHFIE